MTFLSGAAVVKNLFLRNTIHREEVSFFVFHCYCFLKAVEVMLNNKKGSTLKMEIMDLRQKKTANIGILNVPRPIDLLSVKLLFWYSFSPIVSTTWMATVQTFISAKVKL